MLEALPEGNNILQPGGPVSQIQEGYSQKHERHLTTGAFYNAFPQEGRGEAISGLALAVLKRVYSESYDPIPPAAGTETGPAEAGDPVAAAAAILDPLIEDEVWPIRQLYEAHAGDAPTDYIIDSYNRRMAMAVGRVVNSHGLLIRPELEPDTVFSMASGLAGSARRIENPDLRRQAVGNALSALALTMTANPPSHLT